MHRNLKIIKELVNFKKSIFIFDRWYIGMELYAKIIELNNYLFDDGITGQTFEREGWDNLLKDIEAGKINCVITKDLSRLGRDHSETGYYIEKYFPEHRVRYISINDNWDSKYDLNDDGIIDLYDIILISSKFETN